MHNQKTITTTTSLLPRLLLLLCLVAMSAAMRGQGKPPVITIACDWDFAPFEFINNEGENVGFNIDVLHNVLKELHIPHEFMMRSRKQSIAAFEHGDADLIVDYKLRFDSSQYVRSRSILHYLKLQVASKNGVPALTRLDQLGNGSSIIFNNLNDSVVYYSLIDYLPEGCGTFTTPREALTGIANGDYDYFIWAKEPLEWKIKEYNLQGISLHDFNLPASGIHIVGRDKNLIDEIDSQLARMQQDGTIDRLRDKWFHPEKVPEAPSQVPLYAILVILFVIVLMTIAYRLISLRVRSAVRYNQDMEALMKQALNMGNYSVMAIDVKRNYVSNLYGSVLPYHGITLEQMKALIKPEDQQVVSLMLSKSPKQKDQVMPFCIQWNKGSKEQPRWITVRGHMFPEYDEGEEQPARVIITSRDVTSELKEERLNEEQSQRYVKMFDSTLVAMSFYDREGHLIDLNEKMKELISTNEESLNFFKQTSLFDMQILKGDFDPESHENFHVCHHMHHPEFGVSKYVEFRLRPTVDEQGNIAYYIISAREVTSERNMYLELERQDKTLQEMEATNNRYEEEMKTLLENCNMYVWHYELGSELITFSRSLKQVDFSRTMEEHIESMYEDEQEQARQMLQNLPNVKKSFSMVHHFRHTPTHNRPCWFAISGMPLTGSKGEVREFFGIVRDVTDLMEAQERLKEETARAENSAMLKATFLANMTHEIRTPLNAIVGFSDLLHMVNTTEERKEFVHIIHNNCDMLMRLINDIFEASTMDVKPLEIKPEEVDFAEFFNLISQSLAQRVQTPGVEFIVENPYSSLVTTLDKGRMQQVITNFVTNAVKYTKEGHIRIGYRLQKEHADRDEGRSGLYMYCEDTGTGIPPEQQQKVFERFVKLNDFVQGTGLGLNICKAIAERSNGSIGVSSDGEGHGSTFWIWVPCTVISSQEQ